MKTYDLATSFSNIPYGRHPQDGANSGERFRQDCLLPWLRQALVNNETVEIDLDGLPLGVGSAFLEESFGGLVRDNLFSKQEVLKALRIKSDNDASYVEEIFGYVRQATPSRNDILHYRGFAGNAQQEDPGFAHGRLLYIDDVVTYETSSIQALKAAFEEAVDDYLLTCRLLDKPSV
ncbi:STAS-like domain-containing protein [Oceanimonas smirnovii]|uniref:STAS-like domain-containing protein n=1 Tax=Oceanimonas smirnovii TaxID=264574 RepID=UPI003FD32787